MNQLIHSKFLIILILILGLVLRLLSLNQSLWLDEATSALVVREMSYSEIINKFSLGDFHPPFYYILLKFWSGILGTTEIALRSLSVTVGTITIYLVYLLGRIVNKRVGLISALFMAVNGLHIFYSQEARMYILSTFFVCMIILFFVKTLSENKASNWTFLSIALALNSLTDYLPNLIIPVIWIAAYKYKKRDKMWWRSFLISHLVLVLIWVFWWLPYFLKQLQFGLSTSSTTPLWWNILGLTNFKNILLIPIKFMLGRISFESNLLYFFIVTPIMLGYFAIFLKGIKKLLKQKHTFLLWLTLPLVVAALVGFKIPVFYYFRLLFVLPAFLLIMAICTVSLSERLRKFGVGFIVVVSLLTSLYYLFSPKFHREDWRGTVSYIEQESKRSSYNVVFSSGKQYEAYSYYGDESKIVNPDKIGSNTKELWLVRYVQDIFDPNDKVAKSIESMGFKKNEEIDFRGIMVWRYSRN